jgi:catechol 2,3-dioxygenase
MTSSDAALPADTRVGRVALRVAALDEVTAFYQTVVGLTVFDRGSATTTLGAGDTPMVVLEATPDAPPRRRTGTGLYHVAVRVPSRAALGGALARVRGEWRLDGASDHGVSEALYLADPEGNGVEVYRDRPRDEWPETGDGRVAMATDPLDLDDLASAAGDDDRVPPGTDVGHVHVEVSSLDAVRSFYVDALGFRVRATVPGALFVAAGDYHHHLGANTWRGRTTPVAGRGLAWVEVVVPTTAALDAVRARLVDRDVAVTERTAGLSVVDPDGVEVRVRAADAR